MLSVSDALTRILALAPAMSAETIALTEAAGRVLAEDAVATRDQPPFLASAMDGYAVRAEEARRGAVLVLVGEAAAGRRANATLPPGSAIRVFTGAPMPEGADSILIQENADRNGDRIKVVKAPAPSEYFRPAGCDFTAGFRLTAPRRLTARDIALLAAMNIAEIRAARKPIVALVPTGNELTPPGATPGPDQIVSSNDYGLAAMLAAVGALPRQCPIARDTVESLKASIAAAKGADIIVSLGGASVGDYDLVSDTLSSEGLDLDFHKIAMRPGKPLMAGRMGSAMMLGLPGNPVSAMVCGEIFLRPAINKTLGLPTGPRPRHLAAMAHDLPANGGREHYMRAIFNRENGALPTVNVDENQDSSSLGILARANCLVVRAPHARGARKGTLVEYIPLD